MGERPSKYQGKLMRTVGFSVPVEDAQLLTEFASQEQTTLTDVLRRQMEPLLERLRTEQTRRVA
jgi:hypothetical protein